MFRVLAIAVSGLCLMGVVSRGEAQSSYPTVYGSTGQPYGPTQAEYQYQRQYGRPWHGYGGQTSSGLSSTRGLFRGTHSVSGWSGASSYGHSHHYGYAGPWGPPVFGYGGVSYPFASVVVVAPVSVTTPGPYVSGLDALTHPGSYRPNVAPLNGSWRRNAASTPVQPDFADGLGPIQPVAKKLDPTQVPVAESSTSAKLRSLERQSIGDEKMRKQLWAQAYIDYRAAVDVAPDRAEAHYRLGYVFASLQHYGSAVREFKRGVFLDPTLPQTGAKLVTVFGPNSQIMRTSLMHKVADWLREDIRDPDRLFLLAVLLHFEDDARAREVFEAAQRMASLGERSVDHIVAYLSLPVEQPESAGPKPAPGEIDLPPLPKPQPAAVGVGRTPTERDDLPPAPVPDESTPTLTALSGVATPPTVDAVP